MGLAAARLDPNLTDLADPLERQGLIHRERDTADRRRIVIHPIPAREAEIAPPFCRC